MKPPVGERVDNRSARFFLAIGAGLLGIGVAAGAFGAHGLEGMVSPERVEVYNTGVLYHLLHALALLILGLAIARWPGERLLQVAGYLLIAGIVIFSGSLYLLVLTDTGVLGAITPIGGVAFIAGWAVCVYAFLRAGSDREL